jgi:NADP-reducing hydrogenase subunit HndB
MEKLTQKTVAQCRDEKKKELAQRLHGSRPVVLIGMGTCGVAAGGREAWSAFEDELKKNGIDGVLIEQTGCIGLCYSEPTVEVRVPGMPDILYGNVDAKTARTIVKSHIIEKRLVDNHIFDKPGADICKQ